MRRLLEIRPWLAALVVYLVSRVVSTILLGTMFVVATANHWRFASHRAHSTFFSFSGSWDASAYRTIAEHGYPTTLPLDAAGHVLPNPWAFLPVYPWAVHALTSLVGVNGTPNGFYTAGAVVSAVAGAMAAGRLSAILRRRIPPERALFAVVLFCVGPMGFLLQAAYAESLFLVLLFAALWCLVTRHYWLLIPFAVVAAFTRPGVLALALVLGIHFVVRLRERRMHGVAFPVRDAVGIVVGAAVTAAAGLTWPLVASAVTRRPGAYLDTELAFWVGFVGRRHFTPLTPWFAMATTYLGPVLGVLAVVLVLALGVFWLTRRPEPPGARGAACCSWSVRSCCRPSPSCCCGFSATPDVAPPRAQRTTPAQPHAQRTTPAQPHAQRTTSAPPPRTRCMNRSPVVKPTRS